MFNPKIFMYLVLAPTIGIATSVFQFNSVDAGIGFDNLVITLENWGGIAGIHIDRIYNSYSESLTIADHDDVRQTFISEDDNRIKNLKNIIGNSTFFDTNPKNGDPSACCNLIHSTMSISMGINGSQQSHTV